MVFKLRFPYGGEKHLPTEPSSQPLPHVISTTFSEVLSPTIAMLTVGISELYLEMFSVLQSTTICVACHSKNKFLNGGDFKKRKERRNPNPLVIFWSLILRSECSFPGQADISGGTPQSLRTVRPGCRASEGRVGCTSPHSFVHCPTAASHSPLEKVGAYHKSRVSAARMLCDAQSLSLPPGL